MKIEIDTSRDSQDEIKEVIRMLKTIVGDNSAFENEVKETKANFSERQSIDVRQSSDERQPIDERQSNETDETGRKDEADETDETEESDEIEEIYDAMQKKYAEEPEKEEDMPNFNFSFEPEKKVEKQVPHAKSFDRIIKEPLQKKQPEPKEEVDDFDFSKLMEY